MKKFMCILMVLAMMLSAMTVAVAEEEKDLLARIQERGTIIVATEGTWAPWTYHNEEDVLVGFDVEVAQKIAEKLGVIVDFEEVAWDGIFAGLDKEQYDVIISSVSITPERSVAYELTEPYVSNALVIVTKK